MNYHDIKHLESEGVCKVLDMFLFDNVHFESWVKNNHASNGIPVCHKKLKQNKTHSKYFEPSINFFLSSSVTPPTKCGYHPGSQYRSHNCSGIPKTL